MRTVLIIGIFLILINPIGVAINDVIGRLGFGAFVFGLLNEHLFGETRFIETLWAIAQVEPVDNFVTICCFVFSPSAIHTFDRFVKPTSTGVLYQRAGSTWHFTSVSNEFFEHRVVNARVLVNVHLIHQIFDVGRWSKGRWDPKQEEHCWDKQHDVQRNRTQFLDDRGFVLWDLLIVFHKLHIILDDNTRLFDIVFAIHYDV